MKIKLSYDVFDEYLKIRITGENPYEDVEELLMTIKRLFEQNNRHKVLVDANSIVIPSEIEKFRIGEMGVEVLGKRVRIALFTKPEYINKFFENVAVNRGGQLYVAGSEKEALDWLLK